MTPTDVAAWVGAITGSLVLLWDVFKWVLSGVRIRVSAAPNMTAYGSAAALLGMKTCIVVEASNVGRRQQLARQSVNLKRVGKLQLAAA